MRPSGIETTALAAAYLAGIAQGVWSGIDEVESFCGVDRRFDPRMREPDRRNLLDGWRTALARARSDLQAV